jgi:hypothetical protein
MKATRNLLALAVLLAMMIPAANAEIEAVKGKRYSLSKNHGPWMIMVAAIRDVKEEERRVDGGMSAWEAADEIVYELRKKGIPAYTYSQEEESEELQSIGAGGSRRYIAQQGYISVLAANFKSNDEKDARNVLTYIKNKFNPKFLSDEKSGGILPKTPGRPTPFSRAFLTINPLYEGEVRDSEKDTLLTELNHGQKHTLLSNRGEYTLVIASFHGSSVVQIGSNSNAEAQNYFEKQFGVGLDTCAENAMKLADSMRNAKKLGYDENYEAYVFHDEFKSIVTIGSFDSKEDPRIRQLYTKFAGKQARHPQTGQEVTVGETFTVPRVKKAGDRREYEWVFDADPKLMDVPRIGGSGSSRIGGNLLNRVRN